MKNLNKDAKEFAENNWKRQIDDNYSIRQINNEAFVAGCNKLIEVIRDEEVGLYERYLDEFTDAEGKLKPCNPDAIFNWIANKVWRKD